MTPQDNQPSPNRGTATKSRQPLRTRLRRKAETIVERHRAQIWDSSPRTLVARQIALTLEELDGLREARQSVHDTLLQAEAEFGTAMLQAAPAADRLRMQAQVLRLTERRQDFAASSSRGEAELAQRLLELVNRWIHITPEDASS